MTLGAFGVVWGLVWANAAGWGSAEIVISLAAGVLLVIVFVLWERRTDAVFARAGGYASAEQFSDGFTAAMGAVAAFAFIGTVVALGMPARRAATPLSPPPVTTAPDPDAAPRSLARS